MRLVPRPLAHRLFSAFLALLVLVASVGLTVQRHSCRLSGRSTARVGLSTAPLGCGMTSSRTTSFKDKCCDVSQHQHKLATPAATAVLKLLPTPQWLALPCPAWPTAPAASASAGLRAVVWFAADSSPPNRPAGRVLLHFIGVLVV